MKRLNSCGAIKETPIEVMKRLKSHEEIDVLQRDPRVTKIYKSHGEIEEQPVLKSCEGIKESPWFKSWEEIKVEKILKSSCKGKLAMRLKSCHDRRVEEIKNLLRAWRVNTIKESWSDQRVMKRSKRCKKSYCYWRAEEIQELQRDWRFMKRSKSCKGMKELPLSKSDRDQRVATIDESWREWRIMIEQSPTNEESQRDQRAPFMKEFWRDQWVMKDPRVMKWSESQRDQRVLKW